MIGYPYFYEPTNLTELILEEEKAKQDEDFMIFSLSPISKESALKFGSSVAPYVPVIVPESTTSGLPIGDQFCYQFCDQISQICGSFEQIPGTSNIVLDFDGFCQLVSKSDLIINTVSSDLAISRSVALEYAQEFFKDKNIVVQATGLQGAMYKVGSYVQSAGSAGLVAHTMTLAKLAGASGIQILKSQPALVIALPFTGAMFFYGCGAIAGNNTIGKYLTTAGDVLALPMKAVELTWNRYINPVSIKILGVPTILNLTQAFKTGPGYTLQEIRDFIPFNRTSIVRSIKDKLIAWLSK